MASSTAAETEVIISNVAQENLTPMPDKKRGFFSFFRATLFMARRKFSSEPPVQKDTVSGGRGLWRVFVCGMRTLQLQQTDKNPLTPRPIESFDFAPLPPPSPDSIIESFDFAPLPPPSPDCMIESFDFAPLPPSSPDRMSRYASAGDLQALDGRQEEEYEVEDDGDGRTGEIDVKAEEFIAMFYQQMRLQRQESVAEGDAC